MPNRTNLSHGWMLVIGASVGWLMGISVSPVVHIVVAAVIASASAIVGTLAGISAKAPASEGDEDAASKLAGLLKEKIDGDDVSLNPVSHGDSLRINPLPLALLLMGMFVGTGIGVYARTNNWLGPNPRRVIAEWSDAGLTQAEVRRRLFDQVYPPSVGTSKESKPTEAESSKSPAIKPLVAGLFAVSAEDCAMLMGRSGEDLKGRLLLLNRPDANAGVKACGSDEACLPAVREVICSNAK